MEPVKCPICLNDIDEQVVACSNGHAVHPKCFYKWRLEKGESKVECVIGCKEFYPEDIVVDMGDDGDCLDKCLYWRYIANNSYCLLSCLLWLPFSVLYAALMLVFRTVLGVGYMLIAYVKIVVIFIVHGLLLLFGALKLLVKGERDVCDYSTAFLRRLPRRLLRPLVVCGAITCGAVPLDLGVRYGDNGEVIEAEC